jgi:hypothetical protein
MKPAGPLVLIACTLVLNVSRAPAQEASPSGAQWDALAFAGGALGGSEGGAGAIWEFGAGIQFVSNSRLGGRLLVASQNNDKVFEYLNVEAAFVWQWSRNESRAWYLAAGPSALLEMSSADTEQENYWGFTAALGVSVRPGSSGVAPEIRLGVYSPSLVLLGARLYLHFGPL